MIRLIFRAILCGVAGLAAGLFPLGGAGRVHSPVELKRLTLEELMDLEVTSVSRRTERFSGVGSALDVITQDHIRRSGVLTLPDALRLATGMHVARSDGQTWAVSARGFNLTSANKLQVNQDGRSLYTPLYSGVFWDVQDTFLGDIDRIEVIRGPGATMWGANAVNGVINIVTRPARETQGVKAFGLAGSQERGSAGVRYGGRAGESTYYRVYLKGFVRDGLRLANGSDSEEDWKMGRVGFRADSQVGTKNTFTIQGDAYRGDIERLQVIESSRVAGGNLIGRWRRVLDVESELQLQGYYDRTERRLPLQFEENRHTVDLDFQHRLAPAGRHHLMWGANYRLTWDENQNPVPNFLFLPARRTIGMFSGFLQDEIILIPRRLGLTVGSKVEYNSSTGYEYQPSIRIAHTPRPGEALWASVSRAVRTPARLDEDLLVPGAVRGSRDFRSEVVWAYEAGYRFRPTPLVGIDLAGYHNRYNHLRSLEPRTGFQETVISNLMEGTTRGIEATAHLQPWPWWSLRASYSRFWKELRRKEGSLDPTTGEREGDDPRQMFSVFSSWDLPRAWQVDLVIRSVGSLPSPAVPGYTVADLRLAWYPRADLELALVGRDLPGRSHPEFGAQTPLAREVERSVYLRATWAY